MCRVEMLLMVFLCAVGFSVVLVEGDTPPPGSPDMTVDGVKFPLKGAPWWRLGTNLNISCDVSGGSSSTAEIVISCGASDVFTEANTNTMYASLELAKEHKDGICECSATQCCGYDKTTKFNIKVAYGPENVTVIPQTDPFMLCPSENSNMTLTCSLKEDINPDGMIKMSVSGTHTTPPVITDIREENGDKIITYEFRPTIAGSHSVHCQVVNSVLPELFGNDTKTIEVYAPPQPPEMKLNGIVMEDGGSKLVHSGERVVALCNVEGGYPAVNNVTIDCAGTTNTSHTTEASLQIDVNLAHHQRSCNCSYTHASTCSSPLTSSFMFLVQAAANITNFTADSKSMDKMEVKKGDSVRFECLAEGYPVPEMSVEKEFVLQDGAEVASVGQTGHRLTLTKVMGCGDSGIYECVARNGIGAFARRQMTVLVRCNAEVADVEKSMDGMLSQARFKINMYPDPNKYELLKDGNDQNRKRRAAVDAVDSTITIDPNDYTITYTRENLEYGFIDLKWVNLDTGAVSNLKLKVWNGVDEEGAEIAFSFSRNENVNTDPSSNTANYIDMLVTSIIGGSTILILLFIGYLVFREVVKSKRQKKMKAAADAQRKQQQPVQGFPQAMPVAFDPMAGFRPFWF